MNKKILIDARKLGDGGIGVYIENLVDGLLEINDFLPHKLDFHLLTCKKFLGRRCTSERDERFQCLERWGGRVSIIPDCSPKYSLQEYFLLPIRQRKLFSECDLYHSPHYTLPFFLKIPSLVTVHDIIHISHPDRNRQRLLAKSLIRSALCRASHVITVSEASRAAIRKIAAPGISLDVIPNAVRFGIEKVGYEDINRCREIYQISGDYILFVGTDRPHKGFADLIKALPALRKLLHGKGKRLPKLIVVGNRFSPISQRMVKELDLSSVVHFCGEVSLRRQAALYSGASAVIVPSKIEGFGLVALEALACGVPVVATPVASIFEICGDCAWYSNNFSSEAIAEVLYQALTSPEVAKEKSKKGLLRAGEYRRSEVARRTVEIYYKLLGLRAEGFALPNPVQAETLKASGA